MLRLDPDIEEVRVRNHRLVLYGGRTHFDFAFEEGSNWGSWAGEFRMARHQQELSLSYGLDSATLVSVGPVLHEHILERHGA